MAIVHEDVDGIARRLVELDDRVGVEAEHVLDVHPGPAELDLDPKRHVVEEITKKLKQLEHDLKRAKQQVRDAEHELARDVLRVIEKEHGPVYIYSESLWYQTDDKNIASQLDRLSSAELADALLSKRFGDVVRVVSQGYWGDITEWDYSSNGPLRDSECAA